MSDRNGLPPIPQAILRRVEEMCQAEGTNLEYLRSTPRGKLYPDLRYRIAEMLHDQGGLSWAEAGTVVGRKTFPRQKRQGNTTEVTMEAEETKLEEMPDIAGMLAGITARLDSLESRLSDSEVSLAGAEGAVDDRLVETLKQAVQRALEKAEQSRTVSWEEGLSALARGEADFCRQAHEAFDCWLGPRGYHLAARPVTPDAPEGFPAWCPELGKEVIVTTRSESGKTG